MRFYFILLFLPAIFAWQFHLPRINIEDLAMRAIGFTADPHCGWTRRQALSCIAQYIDTDHDKTISPEEFEYAKSTYLPPVAQTVRWAAKKLGFDITYADVLAGCDVAPRDGKLTLSDWIGGAKQCLPGEADLCKFKTVCDIARKKNGHH